MIFGDKAIVLGYERILPKNQSISINIGRASYPKLVSIDFDSIKLDVEKGYTDNGFNTSIDYRFYPLKLNKYGAPRGVYFGPYYSYNYFKRTINFNVNTEPYTGNVESQMKINIHSVGFQLGYQFVFWKRLSVDMILFGPGVAYYSMKVKVNSSVDPNTEGKLFEIFNNYLEDKFPAYSTIINGEEFKKSGTTTTPGLTYRYMVLIGYRF